jgi:hypothetical protein
LTASTRGNDPNALEEERRNIMKKLNTTRSSWNAARHLSAPALALAVLMAPAGAYAAENRSGWSWNFTPVLILPKGDHNVGGGVDPEVQYTLDQGLVRWSAGLRVGGYYANDLFGVTTMPTARLTLPVGPVEPYVAVGVGYGWLPDVRDDGLATMSRLGIVFRFSESFALNVEGTLQGIDGTDFRFPSIGSMLSFDL